MSWILFSILAAFIWAIVNTVDKYVLTKWVKEPIIPVMIMGIVGLIASFIIFLVQGFPYLSPINIALAFIAGIFYILANSFYFRAAKLEEISRVAPLFNLAPIFVLILAAIFLGEIFSPIKYLGIFSLVMGAILISSKNYLKFSFKKPFWLMMASVISFAITLVITKYLLNSADYWTIFAYIRLGTIGALIPIFYFHFGKLASIVKEHGKKIVGLISINETLNIFGILLFTIAAASGYITLVESLASAESFFLLLITIIISIFYPKVLREDIKKSTVLLKFIALILIFIGVVLIS
ncbi:MAG: EamA family transporter [Patescibacteria group bacterium]|nr:EamA family transporter [Patescibacteria group bacterium]MDD5294638.1 EamA family transporter [Patescibacteria group bacterium]MDD5554547.1 EamA family transporter [Patescibacteria group bacterium]